jgi:DNA polymerase-1
MLRRLESDYKAEYRACVFDAKGKTFRDDWYPDYKAHRPPMPDDLRAQIEPLHEAVKAEGWPLLMDRGRGGRRRHRHAHPPGRRAAGWEVVISTGDKDLTQLVQPGVRWVNTMSEEVLDEAGVPPSSACRRIASSTTSRWSATPWTTCPAWRSAAPRPR